MIAKQLITLRFVLQLTCDDTRMDLVRRSKTPNVALCKKRRFYLNEVFQLPLGRAKLCGGLIRHSLFFWNVSAGACALTLKLDVKHHGGLTVLLNHVFKFVAQNKPEIVDAVKA